MFDPRAVPGYEEFKLNVLGDASEDAWAIQSPLASLRGNIRDFVPLPQLTEEQSREVVEAALRDLFAEGLIYFFRYVTESLNRDANDAALRLTEAGSRDRRRCLALAGSHNGRSLHDYCEGRTRVLQGVQALEPRLGQFTNA